jgi:hypothetical protein
VSYDYAYVVYLTTVGVFAIAVLLSYSRWPSFRIPAAVLVLLVGVFYLVPVWMMRDISNADIDNFHRTARLVRSWTYVYSVAADESVPFHPYLPFQMFVVAIADWISNAAHVAFSVPLKLPNVIAVAATALLVRSAVTRLDGARAAGVASLALIFNPVLLDVTAYHGQFDALPALLAFAAWFQLRFKSSRADEMSSALLLGLAIVSKTWPLVLLPVFLWHLSGDLRYKALWAGIALAVPSAFSLGYAFALGGSVSDMISVVRSYNGIYSLGGYSFILHNLPGSQSSVEGRMAWVAAHQRVVMWCGMLAVMALVFVRRQKPELAITAVLVGLYVFAPSSTPEYFVWLLPFAIVSGERAFPFAFSLLVGVNRCSRECQAHFWNWAFNDWVLNHAWIPFGVSYCVVVLWLVWLMIRMLRSSEADTGTTAALGPAQIALDSAS